MLVVATNTTDTVEKMLASNAKVPAYRFKGSNMELGSTCGKPYAISLMAILKPGDSQIMKLKDKK